MKQFDAIMKSGFWPLTQAVILGVLFLSLVSFIDPSSWNGDTVPGLPNTVEANDTTTGISKPGGPVASRGTSLMIQTPPDEPCSPLSTLPCEDIVVNLPVLLDFSGSVPNSLLDGNGNGTGFTAVLEHSEGRRAGDLPISNPDVNGYEPSLINLNNGGLELVSQAGINYLNPPASSKNNNQVNTLGVGFQNITTALTIETSLLNITTGTGSAQAGIWFGIDEDNFVKLNINADNIELRKEVGGESINSVDSPDQIQVENVGVTGQNVKLRMVIDPLANTVTAYYAINEGAFIQVVKSGLSVMALPQAYLAGRVLNNDISGVSFAGIYDTHRNGRQFTASFDSFSATAEKEDLSLAFDSESLSFEGIVGEDIATQNVNISATSGNPTFTLSDDPNSAEWLILPTDPQLGTLEFGIKSGLPENTYSTTVFAIDPSGEYTTAAIQVNLDVRADQPASDQNDIESFSFAEATGPAVINLEGHLVDIEVAKGTALEALSPTITISDAAAISPASGVVQDFTGPVAYTVTAADGTMQDWSVRVKEATLAGFAFTEDFNSYGTGNLHEISGGAWSREKADDAAIPVLNEGLSPSTAFSLDFSTGQQTHDFETLINSPVDLVAGQPFYFNTYFKVAQLGQNSPDRIRTAVRIDDAVNGDQWVREQIAQGPGNTLIARIGLGAPGSNQGNVAIAANETIQFLVRGIWDGENTISYSWTVAPKINLDETQWTEAGTHNVQGTPRLGRIFIGSNGINDGRLGPLRLATNYKEVVTEENVAAIPQLPLMSLSPQRLVSDAIVNGNAPARQEVKITNDGDAPLNDIEITITGENPEDFTVTNIPLTIAAKTTEIFEVVFNPATTGPKYALLTVTATDVEDMNVTLNGLGKKGAGGDNEPSLQWVFDTQLGKGAVAIGDNNPETNKIDLPSGKTYNDLLGDELAIKRFERASSGEVTLEVLSAFGPENNDPVTAFGWYSSGDASAINELFTVSNAAGNGQRLNPKIEGSTSFEPGTATFGFYSKWPFFNDRMLFSEDALNTFNGAIPHHVRVYAMPREENAYIIATEEHVSGFDYQDIVVIARNIKPAGVAVAGCNPISTLDCDALEVSLPYALSFNGEEGGLSNTGFTMVDNPSARLAIDGAISYPEVPGYEPGRISFSNGRLLLNAANGLAFAKNGTSPGTSKDVNSQINTLGVGINARASGNLNLKTTIVNPYADASLNFEQAGLWFGLNEDNYAKLVVINGSSLQLLTEVDAVSDEDTQSLKVDDINGLHTGNLSLRLYVDKDNDLLTAFYSIDNGAEVNLGSLPLPASFTQGNSAYGNLTFTGVMTSKRRELNATVNYAFEGFEVKAEDAPAATFDPIFINFSDVATAAPTGYSTDSGSPYADRGNGYSYGWLNAETSTPADLTKNARNRAKNGVNLLNNTLIHMQYGDVGTDPTQGYFPDTKWEIAIPNGSYSVTVNVGDPTVDGAPEDTPKHTINAEGINLIDQFVPTGTVGTATRFTAGSARVVVRDGKLTIDPTGGFNTKINSLKIEQVAASDVPYFTGVNPEDGATDVLVHGFQIAIEVVVPNGYELDKKTTSNARIFEITANGEQLVPTNSNDTGGGDAIVLTPLNDLKENTTYLLRMPSTIEANKIGDINDRIAFETFESRFTTGEEDVVINQPGRDLASVTFTQVRGDALGERVQNERFSSMQVGPDGKLYASTIGDFQSDGKIFRWNMAKDGTLTNLEVLSPELTGAANPVNGSPQDNDVRLIIGFRFDPASTADNLVAYITHSKSSESDGPEWDGKLTRLSGPALENVQDVIIHLPRSKKDHLTNSIAFDTAGDLYISQGSNTAGGEPDPAWAFRPERLLSGAILKVELDKLPATLPLDAFTTNNISVINSAPTNSITMSDGTYNPYAANSPLTIFATGVRNAYDLLWHSNGWLYVPTNGTAGNNKNSPNSPSTANYELARRIDGRTTIPDAPALFGGNTQKDWLFKTKGGTYHGHPNPYRGEFVLNHGGSSYSGVPGQVREPFKDVTKYPTSVQPDPNYTQPAFDFDYNKSPNGVIEYKSDAFGGKLKGLIMVVQFSGQDNLLLLDPGSNGDIAYNYSSVTGLGGFDDPIEVVEDPKTGNIYVSEYDRDGSSLPQLTLLRAAEPAEPGALIAANPKELIFETTVNKQGQQSQQKKLLVTNEGAEVLTITDVSINGKFADQFDAAIPSGAQNIEPGSSLEYTVTYAPDLDQSNIGYQDAALVINSNDEETPQLEIGLFGLKKKGFEGNGEPALQDVVNALGIGLNVGWTTLANNTDPAPIADEIEVERWVKLNAQTPVTITPVGRYSPAESLPFGWYTNNGEVFTQQIGVLQDGLANAQTLYPPMENGEKSVDFDPQGAVFGFFVESKSFKRFNYTEDALNVPSGVAHRTRIYPNKDRRGNTIPNSYLITFEDASNGDYQDYMFIMDNVVPFDDAVLAFGFNKEALDFNTSVNEENSAAQEVTLSVSGPVGAAETRLDATEDWVVLPESFEFDNPFEIGIDAEGLAVGNYQAVVTASSTNYSSASLTINLTVTDEVLYVYQFNFQDPADVEVSPEGYIDDLGKPFSAQNTDLGTLEFGWVLPGTDTPANAALNARNRNTGTNDDPLLKTFTIIGHREAAKFPLRDWKVNLPNGSYFVNISVGENDFRDSNHVLDVNGITVVDFDQENNNPNNLITAEGTRLVDVTDGTLRLSLNERGVNAKPNYIRIAPVNTDLLPPSITATLDGLMFEENVYKGAVEIALAAEDRSGSGSINRLEYSLDDAPAIAYTEPFSVTEAGEHSILIEAEDANGNMAAKTITFIIQEPSGAILYMENMTKVPGTQRGFPADDYYTFYRIGNPNTIGDAPNTALTHDTNIMRLNNTGTGTLIISDIKISDTRDYTYTILNNVGEVSLPLSIAPGASRDLRLRITASTTNGRSALFKESITITSNADNGAESVATLNGAFAPQPEGGDEITAQQVFDAFGFTSTMRSIVNDNGTITPPNGEPTRPGSNYPKAENIDAGYEGDLILSSNFVQADKSKPVIGMQLSALHGKGADNGRFVAVNGTGTVGGMDFRHTVDYYQTLLPQRGGEINADRTNSINGPFRIAVANYLTSGGNNINGARPDLLGLRIYKAKDRDGNIIPNEYIALQDFVQNGCGPGSANCDWNDNTFYFINIRPEAQPSALPIEELLVNAGTSFDQELSGYFEKGYPGNKLIFSARLADGSELPSWMSIDAEGRLTGTVPVDAVENYTVQITATDLNGIAVSEDAIINVNRSPVAAIAATPQEGQSPLEVTFTGENSTDNGDLLTYSWDFGDGTTSEEINPIHIYEELGTYNAQLTVTDAGGLTDMATITITVAENTAPTAVASADILEGQAPVEVNFTGSESSDDLEIVSYLWDFGNGETSEEMDPSYLYTESGNYEVNLTVTDEKGLTDTATLTITVNLNTAPVAIATADAIEGKVAHTVNFTGSASSDDVEIVAYSWDFGNGDSADVMDPQYTYEVEGNYEVTLTVTDNKGASTTSDVLLISVLPANTAPVAVAEADVTSGAAPLAVQFTGSNSTDDTEVVNYFWNFGNGETSSEANPSLVYGQEGTYTVVLVVEDEEGQFSVATLTITVGLDNTAPVAVIEGGPFTGNTPLDVYFVGSSSTDDKGITNYVWDFGDGSFSNESNPTHRYGNVGTYLAQLTVYDAEGLADVAQTVVQVNSTGGGAIAPIAVANADVRQGTSPLTVSFDGSGSSDDSGVIANYRWTLDDAEISNAANFQYVFDTEGSYEITLTVTDEDGLSNADDITIDVAGGNKAPVAIAQADRTQGEAPLNVVFTGSNSTDDNGIVSYSWIFGDGGTAAVANPEHTYTAAGTYLANLTVTDENGLTDTTPNIRIVVAQAGGNDDVAIYLNTGSSADVNFEGREFLGDLSRRNLYNSAHTYANPQASSVVLYQTERGSAENLETLSYAIPVPNGTYRVQTYHNELWWGKGRAGGAGKRVFDILIENKLVRDDFDIFKASNNRPIRLDFANVVVTDGILNIDLPATADRASISGIAIENAVNRKPVAIASATPKSGSAPLLVDFDATASTDDVAVTGYLWQFAPGATSTEASPSYTFRNAGTYPVTLTVTDAQGLSDQTSLTIQVSEGPVATDVAMYINAGSATDVSLEGHTFVGDKKTSSIYSGEYTYEDTATSSGSLYRTERGPGAARGTLNYAIPVPNGTYTISTYHGELWWGKKGGRATAGKRVFDILVEGNLVKDDFDIFKESNNRPTKLSFYNIVISDGVLNISLPASVDKSTISGIAIEGTSLNEAPIAVVLATPKMGTAPLEVSFSSNGSKDDKGIVSYRWDFKDGSTSTVKNPKHTFATAGTYNVSLRVTDGEGLVDTDEVLIEAVGCSTVPQPWSSTDVGAVAASGATCYFDGQYNVTASGADIWGTRDEFHFVYRQLTGDGEIIAQVKGLTATNNWTKAGVMMRATTATGAKHAFMTLAPDPTYSGKGNYGYAFQSRKGTNSGSVSNTPRILPNAALPYYVRLVRTGNTFTGYISQTNGNWTQVSSAIIAMDVTIQVGLATTSHRDGTIAEAIYDNVSVRNADQTSAIAAAPRMGQVPLEVAFNGTEERANIDASLSYFWEFQDGQTSTEISPKHTFKEAGFYPVSLTVKRDEEVLYQNTVEINAAGSDEMSINMAEDALLETRMYPNPATTRVTLEVANTTKGITNIAIFDIRGRLVLDFDAEKVKTGNRYELNVESLEAGVYMLRISGDQGLIEQKRLLIKE